MLFIMVAIMISGAYLELRLEGTKNPPRSVVSATRPYGWRVRGDKLVYPLSEREFNVDDSGRVLETLEALNRASYVLKILRMSYKISLQGRSKTSQM
ncbi:MAG: hypothetical protein LN416_03415 [Candidatus Thermoplasmatota archaeon]|nr:hypothetical protein [Candidatus Thermoplasmatota archaeon]